MNLRARPARRRSIRVMLGLVFIVPLVSLLVLWGFGAFLTVPPALQERYLNAADNKAGGSGNDLGVDLQTERLLSVVWLSSHGRAPRGPLLAQHRATDSAVTAFRQVFSTIRLGDNAAGRAALSALSARFSGLAQVQASIDARRISPLAAYQDYNGVINALYNYYGAQVQVNDVGLYQRWTLSIDGARGLEDLSRELALVGGSFAAGGRMTAPEYTAFVEAVTQQRLFIGEVLAQMPADIRVFWAGPYRSAAHARFAALENQIISTRPGGRIPVSPVGWKQASGAFLGVVGKSSLTEGAILGRDDAQVGNRQLSEVILVGVVGLVAVGASVFLMVWFGRRISRELRGLQDGAREMAEARLPRVVDRLRRGEDIDVVAESPPLPAGRTIEIARVADAFSTVQRTAVEAAVGEANLRKGIGKIFLGLAWRSQSLLHRQLTMLDAMERRSTEPDALEELFRLDHLTTRMRRHAEGLTILSGSPAVRGWRHPVTVIDVLRGAIAEVEDYTRVNVITQSRDAIAGAVVGDVIHLLAELIENATSFSPPGTQVTVTADRAANGFFVEVEDRGLGIGPEDLKRFNELVAGPPEFDLADGERLGLFVVGTLAARHQISVTLRRSPYGGTTAIVLLPHAIVVSAAGTTISGVEPGDLRRMLREGHGNEPLPTWASGGRPAGELMSAGPTMVADSQTAAVHGDLAWPDGPRPPVGDTGPTGVVRSIADAHLAQPWMPEGAADGAGAAGSMAPDGMLPDGEVAPGGTHLGLPRRVRQARMPPQLRSAVGGAAPPVPGEAGPEPPSPADSQALVSSMQRGWQRGRADADELFDVWTRASGSGDGPSPGPDEAPAPEPGDG